MRDQVAAGRQAYVVCPLIEESEVLEVESATATHDALSAGPLAALYGRRIAAAPAGIAETEERAEPAPRRRLVWVAPVDRA